MRIFNFLREVKWLSVIVVVLAILAIVLAILSGSLPVLVIAISFAAVDAGLLALQS